MCELGEDEGVDGVWRIFGRSGFGGRAKQFSVRMGRMSRLKFKDDPSAQEEATRKRRAGILKVKCLEIMPFSES